MGDQRDYMAEDAIILDPDQPTKEWYLDLARQNREQAASHWKLAKQYEDLSEKWMAKAEYYWAMAEKTPWAREQDQSRRAEYGLHGSTIPPREQHRNQRHQKHQNRRHHRRQHRKQYRQQHRQRGQQQQYYQPYNQSYHQPYRSYQQPYQRQYNQPFQQQYQEPYQQRYRQQSPVPQSPVVWKQEGSDWW